MTALSLDNILDRAVAFHGHLGPFLVLGMRMGLLGRSLLRDTESVVLRTSVRPPSSCVIDGVQVSSGFTVGKGSVLVEESSEVSAEFRGGGRSIEVALRIDVHKDLLESIRGADVNELEKIAYEMLEAPVNDLFILTLK